MIKALKTAGALILVFSLSAVFTAGAVLSTTKPGEGEAFLKCVATLQPGCHAEKIPFGSRRNFQ